MNQEQNRPMTHDEYEKFTVFISKFLSVGAASLRMRLKNKGFDVPESELKEMLSEYSATAFGMGSREGGSIYFELDSYCKAMREYRENGWFAENGMPEKPKVNTNASAVVRTALDGFTFPKDLTSRDFLPGGRMGDNIRDWRNEL